MKCAFITVLLGSALMSPGQTLERRAKPYLDSARAAGDAFVSVNSASGMPNLAADALATALNSNLSTQTQVGTAPYPTSLGGISVQVADSAGVMRPAQLLYVSPSQINYLVPPGTAAGSATVNVVNGAASSLSSTAQIQTVAPGIFTANGDAQGVVAATAYRTIAPSGPAFPVSVYQCGTTPGSCVSVPIDLGLDTPVFVTFYTTGLRTRSSDSAVALTIGGQTVPIRSITAQDDSGAQAGIDEVTAPLILSLRGKGEVEVIISVDGKTSNTAGINIGNN